MHPSLRYQGKVTGWTMIIKSSGNCFDDVDNGHYDSAGTEIFHARPVTVLHGGSPGFQACQPAVVDP